ncbi:hypothetical protein B0H10DRAFT_2442049 [Mycena sp. CBHHK59/15]|nr:hypothetical protein B0H10DRAFT_2442049 [Mycena sp. CBHHK59/15]
MADLTRNTAGMVHHASTPAGQTAYQLQVQAWAAANPTKYQGGDEYAPYPLTPGTEAVGTGECFDCGARHFKDAPHTRAIVDVKETFYRRVANRIIRDDRDATNMANAAGLPANVHLVHVEATDDHPAHWVSADTYGQGNGDGPEGVVIPGAEAASSGEEEKPHTNLVFTDDMYSEHGAMNCVDVYGVGEGREGEEVARPFTQTVQLVGTSGELVDVVATFDDCAMVNCIDTAVFEGARATLSSPGTSPRVLRMANGVLVPSGGCWRGKISVGGVSAVGKWEIFSGGGAWQMLLGKPMLKAFGATLGTARQLDHNDSGSGKTGYLFLSIIVMIAIARTPSLCPSTKFPVDLAIVVVCPTNSIEQQMENMAKIGVAALTINSDTVAASRLCNIDLWNGAREGISMLILGPEQLISNGFRDLLAFEPFYDRVCPPPSK